MTFDDVLAMVKLAEPGMREVDWRHEAARASRFPLASQRNEQLRIATLIVRPSNGRIEDALFLEDIRNETRVACRDMIYGRYLCAHAIAVELARELFVPRVRHPELGTKLDVVEIDEFLASTLPAISLASRRRTRSAAVTEFVRAGVLRGSWRSGLSVVGAASLHPKAFAHLLIDDLRVRGDATDAWIATESTPTVVFALQPDRVHLLLDEIVELGLVRRSYLAGRPRVLLA